MSEFHACAATVTQYYCKSCERERPKPNRKGNLKRHVVKLRAKIIALLGGKCVCCGEVRFEFLALDHIYGGGRQHRMKRNNLQIYREVEKMAQPETAYRLLCHNCNLAVGFYGYCPHGGIPDRVIGARKEWAEIRED